MSQNTPDMPQGGTITADPEVRTIPAEPGDHEKLAHYTSKAMLTDAMVFGIPATALCGKKWIPSRDPEKFPVCPECKEIWESMRDE